MELAYIFDTNAFINLFRTDKRIFGILYYFSIITEIELLSFPKLTESERRKIELYCQDYGRLELNSELLNDIIYLRKKYKLKVPDSIICGTALAFNLVLITDDKKLLDINEIKSITFNQLLENFQ